MTQIDSHVLRAELLSFEADPGEGDTPAEGSIRHLEDGALWVENGCIRAVDHFERLAPTLPAGIEVIDHCGKLIMPGFIDSHVHYLRATRDHGFLRPSAARLAERLCLPRRVSLRQP